MDTKTRAHQIRHTIATSLRTPDARDFYLDGLGYEVTLYDGRHGVLLRTTNVGVDGVLAAVRFDGDTDETVGVNLGLVRFIAVPA